MGMPEGNPFFRRKAITNIIDSVAKEQDALAKILDAEGDKLKKFICNPYVCPEMLLTANRSVQKTIKAITRLETILEFKLELFEDCLCPCPCEKKDECTEECAE